MTSIPDALREADARAVAWMEAHGTTVLRMALGTVFVWFGGLKLIGRSPVTGLVTDTIPWIEPEPLVLGLGLLELAVGIGLMAGKLMRLVLALFWLQMGGTLLVPVLLPHVTFQGGNPLLLTTEGEFVVKNLVLLAAGIVLGGTVPRSEPPPERHNDRDR